MPYLGKLEKNTALLLTYKNDETPTSYFPEEIGKMLEHLKITYRTLIEYMSKKSKLADGVELYKLTTDDELVKLI